MSLGTFDRSPPPIFRQGPSALTKLMVFSALYLFALIFAGARLAENFARRKRLSSSLSGAVGALFVWFGVKLATASLN